MLGVIAIHLHRIKNRTNPRDDISGKNLPSRDEM